MSKDIKYGIIGLGRFGLSLAKSIIEGGDDVIAVDIDEDRTSLLSDMTDNVFVIHQINKDSFIEAGLDKCEVVVIGIGRNIESSLLAALQCIELKIPRVIAKANSEEHARSRYRSPSCQNAEEQACHGFFLTLQRIFNRTVQPPCQAGRTDCR